MDSHQHLTTKEEKNNNPQGEVEAVQPIVAAAAAAPPSSSSSPTTVAPAATSPSQSSSSSPSHDFTFTISLYTSPPKGPNKAMTKPMTPPAAIDLAPADDIFFHGHLLPLRLLTRPPFSPRRSAESLTISINNSSTTIADREKPSDGVADRAGDARERIKSSKSFSSMLTGLTKWRHETDKEEEDMDTDMDKDKYRKKDVKDVKKKFGMKRMLRRYASLVEAILFPRAGAREKRDLHQRPYSFSGVSSNWSRVGGGGGGGGEKDWRRRGKKRWGELSAPASMRTSPTNSGLLVAPPNLASSEDSTMEELQSAIQAAIAHCKNSMNNMKEERCNC